MAKISKIAALMLCVVLSLSTTLEAQATVNNKVKIVEIGDEEFDVTLDMGASQRSNELTCSMSISKSEEDNDILVTFSTSTSTGSKASEVGVKGFVFQQKAGWFSWDTIYSNDFCTYNAYTYAGYIVYTAPVSGETYRAIGTHYAIIDGTEYTYVMISDELDY